MEWFTGGVVDAIATCRRNKSLFIVYIYDDSRASIKTTEAWNNDIVREVLSSNQSVAIQVARDSVEHQQFSQLYPVFVFPSVFCIGLTGKTLVIMNGQQSSSQIKVKLSEAFEKLHSEVQSLQPQATPTNPETPPTKMSDTLTEQPSNSDLASKPTCPPEVESPPIVNEIHSPPSEGAEGEGREGGVQGATSAARTESMEEKLERAEQKIRQRRQEKEEAEFQKQKSAELRRREEGKQMAESRKDHEDMRNKTWIQERKKAKEEERKAREAIRAKLRQDQMERAAQRKAHEQKISDLQQQAIPQVNPSSTRSITTNGTCRLQLRLPSGGKSVIEMKLENSLGMLRERVAEELCVGIEGVLLSSMYPRRELTTDMEDNSLEQLSLAPSGVVVVRLKRGLLMGSGDGSSSGSFTLWGAITWLFQLLMSFVTLVKSFFGIGGSGTNQHETTPTQRSHPTNSRLKGKKVHQFHPGEYEDNSSDDDEERRNTYNGNSTEQQ